MLGAGAVATSLPTDSSGWRWSMTLISCVLFLQNENRENRPDDVPPAILPSGCAASGGSAPDDTRRLCLSVRQLTGYGFQAAHTHGLVIRSRNSCDLSFSQ